MSTEFGSNTFEHDYIVEALQHMIGDLQAGKRPGAVMDKTACILTSFMNGQIVAEVRRSKE